MKMTVEKLKEKLNDLGVSASQYSLLGELNPDTITLNKNYSLWEVYYLDEKGNRNDEKSFDTESDACFYIFKLFKDAKNIEQKFKLKRK